MSKYYVLASLLIVFLIVQCYSKIHNYDDFDMEALLQDATKSKAFFECFRDESLCQNKEDKEMKDDIIEMVVTSCASCTKREKQKYGDARKAMERAMASQVINKFLNSKKVMNNILEALNITVTKQDPQYQ
ncbi:hypothetical protein ABMA28_006392 [Loxostege sticticalis]|uniref:Chemosensory protein n=1 Tax=Loxostege sticticalis TaxID=481309 RepID=A0ABD0SNA6_LOXSC